MTEPPEHGNREREQLDRVRERFTRTADAFSGFSRTVRFAEAERLAVLAAADGAELALDLACGPGTFTFALASRVRRIIGLDLTPALLDKARGTAKEKGLANLFLVCGNSCSLPFTAGVFDIASCGYALHHLSDPSTTLRELARVLRPGGRVALLDLVAPEESPRAEMNNRIERARDVSHVRTLAATEFESLAGAAGFRILRREVAERPRSFDDWMRVGGRQPADASYEEARQLMEASIDADSAGFHPRRSASAAGARPDLEFVQTSLFLIAEKK